MLKNNRAGMVPKKTNATLEMRPLENKNGTKNIVAAKILSYLKPTATPNISPDTKYIPFLFLSSASRNKWIEKIIKNNAAIWGQTAWEYCQMNVPKVKMIRENIDVSFEKNFSEILYVK